MGIVAGLLAQNVLKYLLDFGTVSYYLGYNSVFDFFPKMVLQPSPNCGDKYCLERQSDFFSGVVKSRKQVVKVTEEVENKNKDDNEWGITVESSSDGTEVKKVVAESEESLDDLKAKMKNLQFGKKK